MSDYRRVFWRAAGHAVKRGPDRSGLQHGLRRPPPHPLHPGGPSRRAERLVLRCQSRPEAGRTQTVVAGGAQVPADLGGTSLSGSGRSSKRRQAKSFPCDAIVVVAPLACDVRGSIDPSQRFHTKKGIGRSVVFRLRYRSSDRAVMAGGFRGASSVSELRPAMSCPRLQAPGDRLNPSACTDGEDRIRHLPFTAMRRAERRRFEPSRPCRPPYRRTPGDRAVKRRPGRSGCHFSRVPSRAACATGGPSRRDPPTGESPSGQDSQS